MLANLLYSRSIERPSAEAIAAAGDVNKEVFSLPGHVGRLMLSDGENWLGIALWRDAAAYAAVPPIADRANAALRRLMPGLDIRSRRVMEVASCMGLKSDPSTRETLAEVTPGFGGDPDQYRRDADTYGAAVVAIDGCEGWLSMIDETTRSAFHVSIWRDRAAFDAFVPARDRMIAEATDGTDSYVTVPTLYRVRDRALMPVH